MLLRIILLLSCFLSGQTLVWAGGQGHEHHDHALDVLYHPYLVHFPIAFFFLEAFLMFVWVVTKKDKYQDFSYLIFRLGILATVVAMVAGYIDAGGINSMVRMHFYFAVSVLLINLFRWTMFYKYRWKMYSRKVIGFGWTLLIVSVILVGVTGHLGGKLVYF